MTWIQMFEKRFYTFWLNLFFVSMMMNACSVWLNYDNEFDFLWIFSCYSWPLFYFFLFLKDKFCIEYWNVCQGKIEIITHSKLEYSYANWVKHIFDAFFKYCISSLQTLLLDIKMCYNWCYKKPLKDKLMQYTW